MFFLSSWLIHAWVAISLSLVIFSYWVDKTFAYPRLWGNFIGPYKLPKFEHMHRFSITFRCSKLCKVALGKKIIFFQPVRRANILPAELHSRMQQYEHPLPNGFEIAPLQCTSYWYQRHVSEYAPREWLLTDSVLVWLSAPRYAIAQEFSKRLFGVPWRQAMRFTLTLHASHWRIKTCLMQFNSALVKVNTTKRGGQASCLAEAKFVASGKGVQPSGRPFSAETEQPSS